MILKFKNISAACALFAFAAVFLSAGCVPQQNNQQGQTEPAVNAGSLNNTATTAASPTVMATPAATETSAANLPVTLPVLDAMFADEKFAGELKSKLGLSDEQVQKLQQTAREATAGLNETEENGSTGAATRRAQEQIRGIIGEDKSAQLARLVSERWETGGEEGAKSTAAANGSRGANAVPSDTRIVVNAPAYRMDLFKDGQLVRSYKVGIGYPEFPLPTGTRQANTIIFNPTWTPPDEPWVKGKVKAGEKVEAGSKLNPLGPIKIPIGSPSLIHGGKQVARLGTFASHGCVGLTNPQVQDFALALAQLSGTQVSEQDVLAYEKAKTETKNVKLSQAIPVELRYETIVVEDGKLRVYRDVYERGTNTEENLRRVLEANGASLDGLSEQERTQALEAVKKMAVDAGGQPVDPSASPAGNANGADKKANQNKNVKETKTIKGQKEIVVEIAALKGKGYPAPVDLNTGGKSKKPLNLTAGGSNNGGNNSNSNQTGSNAGQTGNANRAGSRKF